MFKDEEIKMVNLIRPLHAFLGLENVLIADPRSLCQTKGCKK